jgi:A/G-specific adenine glycosylase
MPRSPQTAALLSWYDRARRDLPWRRTRDPYAVWISEAMLQQTRAQTVAGYWRRFLDALPDVRALAAADEALVLGLWSGLGYYRRARALREAAREVVARHGGEFPRTRAEWLALPGIGPYTAGAVLSIAFDLPEPLVDGNVARVLARRFALAGELGSGAFQRELWSLAQRLVPRERAGDWNQALMELGATVCTPRAPRCGECPWTASCLAHAAGRAEELPRARPRPTPIEVELTIAVAARGGALLVRRRPERARMAGLWEFPTREELPGHGRASGLFPADFGLPLALDEGPPLGRVAHAITRHRIRAQVVSARPSGPLGGPPDGPEWIERGRLADLGLTGMARKVLGLLARDACASGPKVR